MWDGGGWVGGIGDVCFEFGGRGGFKKGRGGIKAREGNIYDVITRKMSTHYLRNRPAKELSERN